MMMVEMDVFQFIVATSWLKSRIILVSLNKNIKKGKGEEQRKIEIRPRVFSGQTVECINQISIDVMMATTITLRPATASHSKRSSFERATLDTEHHITESELSIKSVCLLTAI